MSFMDNIIEKLKDGVIDAVKVVGSEFIEQAKADGIDFVKAGAPSLLRYFQLYASAQISQEELKSLVFGLKDLAEMKALTLAGMTAIQVDKTRNTIFQTVTSIATGAIAKLP